MAITFLELAEKVLNETNKPMSYSAIWEYAEKKGYTDSLDSHGKTPKATLSARLGTDIRENPETVFNYSGIRPRMYGLKIFGRTVEGGSENEQEDEVQTVKNFLEIDLHPVLVYYASTFLNLHLKTINASKSVKKSYGEWGHPDIVGCYFPFTTWKSEVVDINTIAGGAAIKLYSFELKRSLSFNNLRESFFQAVSNSSWANEGYLVAESINHDLEFQDELKRLNAAFGIGVVKLDIEDPDASFIMYPSRENEQIDWETVNKLTAMNSDFKYFLERINKDYKTREIRKEKYDKILAREELIAKFKNK